MLVHLCCAPDAVYVMKILMTEFQVSGYFYNPNIHPKKEYDLRRDETRKIAKILGFDLIEGPYDKDQWLKLTEKFRTEPEKGRRCDICYAIRLERTAANAAEQNFEFFTTVMSLSPWKKSDTLNRIGRMFGKRFGLEYYPANFKKKMGFQKSILLSRELGLYRQNYCGCETSEKEMQTRKKCKQIDTTDNERK